jgi:DNA-3-methyladenine glycosylase II
VAALRAADPVLRALIDELGPDGAGLSRAKVGYLRSLAEHVRDGVLALDRLEKLPDEEVVAELVAVRGIGLWSAHMFLMHARAPKSP